MHALCSLIKISALRVLIWHVFILFLIQNVKTPFCRKKKKWLLLYNMCFVWVLTLCVSPTSLA